LRNESTQALVADPCLIGKRKLKQVPAVFESHLTSAKMR